MSLLDQVWASLLLLAYAAAWWLGSWLVLGRPRLPAVAVSFGAFLLGFGLPVLLADLTFRQPSPLVRAFSTLWAALPLPLLGAFAVRWLLRRLRSGR